MGTPEMSCPSCGHRAHPGRRCYVTDRPGGAACGCTANALALPAPAGETGEAQVVEPDEVVLGGELAGVRQAEVEAKVARKMQEVMDRMMRDALIEGGPVHYDD